MSRARETGVSARARDEDDENDGRADSNASAHSASRSDATRARAPSTPRGYDHDGSFHDVGTPATAATAGGERGTSSSVARRIAALERSGDDANANARRASSSDASRGDGWRSGSSSVKSAAALERVAEDVRSVRMKLFAASTSAARATDEYGDALREAGEGLDWRPVVTRAVGVIEDADVDARARAARVAKRVREELDARERERGARLEALAERRREAAAASNRASKASEKKNLPVFLTGVASSSSKHANFVRGGKALDEGAAKATKRLAFEILRSAAGRSRALRRAANDMGMIRRAPILKRAFDALRAHAVICAPRTRAMREACETFVVVTDRRMRRSAFKSWREGVREQTLGKTCAAIHNVRIAQAALHHWELFAARAFWKRKANELAHSYATGRLRTLAFCGWLLHARRVKERRIAVRARMFGMSVPEAQRAIHEKVKYTAHDAHLMMKSELKYLFEKRCSESALRSQVSSSLKLIRTLENMRRFTADGEDVAWASSDSAMFRGIGAAKRHLHVGFSTRGRTDSPRRKTLSLNRDDVAASRTAAAIEKVATTIDFIPDNSMNVDALSADAYELSQEHQRALTSARDATQKCVAARKAAHDTSLRASRLVANADSRANAAVQGAQDAMNESIKAEFLAIEAEESANLAERRAEELSESGAGDEKAIAHALQRAAEAAACAVNLSSAHVAAARVAERAIDIAEEHKEAARMLKAQAEEDVEKAQTRVLEAEAVVMATAKLERELNAKAVNAMKRLQRATGDSVVFHDGSLFDRDSNENAVFSPTKARSAEEKKIMRRRVTWDSFGEGIDDDDDDIVESMQNISLAPGKWYTLAECATQAYAKKLARKVLAGFAKNIAWRRQQRDAAQLSFITNIFTSWANVAHINQTRRRLVESVVDEVVSEDRERRLRAYVSCLQKHAKWRKARCEELKISLRRVVAPTITRPAFDHWRKKVANIYLVRRVVNRAIVAWRERIAKPSHSNAFYAMYDALHAWRRVAEERRLRRHRSRTAMEYHRVTLTLKALNSWRAFTEARAERVRERRIALERSRRRRRLAVESYYRALASRALLLWRAVAVANRQSSTPHRARRAIARASH